MERDKPKANKENKHRNTEKMTAGRTGDAKEHDSSKRAEFWLEILKLTPQFAWVVLIGLLIFWFYGPLMQALQQNSITKLGVGVLQIEFAQKQIQEAAIGRNQDIPAALKDRLQRSITKIRGIAILWVDDNPANSFAERRALASLGAIVDIAKSTNEAMNMIKQGAYSLIVSDEFRKEDKKAPCYAANDQFQPASAGCDLMRQIKSFFDAKNKQHPPIVFYAQLVDVDWGTPVYAFGATPRVDELFHLILDASERQGGNP